MPTLLARCNICHAVFEGDDSYEQAELCEQQGEPNFLFNIGDIVALDEVVDRYVRLNRKTGKHTFHYRLKVYGWGKIRSMTESKLAERLQEYNTHQQTVTALNVHGVPSFQLYEGLTVYVTDKGFYEAYETFGSSVSRSSARGRILEADIHRLQAAAT